MLHKKVIFRKILVIISISILGLKTTIAEDFSSLPKNIQEYLINNNPYVRSNVSTDKDTQSFSFFASGLHHQPCTQALKTIGHYENYQNIIGFVDKSTYQNERINLSLSSSFLPFDMILNFKIPRIYKVGEYPFIFDNGFLLNLTGKVIVKNFTNHKKYKCYIAMTAAWQGKKTKIPDYIFEIFTKTIGEIGISKLFRVSGHRF